MLFTFHVVSLLVLFVGRGYIHYKIYKVNPYSFKNTDSAHDFVGKTLGLAFIAGFFVTTVYTFWPDHLSRLGPISWIENEVAFKVAFVVAGVAVAVCAYAQIHMGPSWRIGIDQKAKTDLVTTGIFRFTRHPIYICILVCHLAFVFIIPNALTFASGVLTWAAINIQARLEEEHMLRLHPESYADYMKTTSRWGI